MKLFLAYYELLVGYRRRALACVLAFALAGLSEGLALISLKPILEHNLVDVGQLGAFSKTLRGFWTWCGLSEQGIFFASIGAFVFLGMGTALATFISDTLRISLKAVVEESFRKRMTEALLRNEWSFFLGLKGGDVGKALLVEGDRIGMGAQHFVRALGLCVIACIFVVAAFAIGGLMTLYCIAFGALAVMVYTYVARRGASYSDRLSSIMTNIADHVNATFDNLKFFRASGRSEVARDEAFRVYRNFVRAYFFSHATGQFLLFLLHVGSVIFIGALLAVMLSVQQESVATTLVFLALFYRLAPRLLAAQEAHYQARVELPFYVSWKERYEEALRHPSKSFGQIPPTFERELALREISYSYPSGQEPALNQLSLRLPKGACCGIVGTSGSGKSTLIDMVVGLMHPDSGHVELDGKPLETLDIEAWRRHIGLVLQDTPIFHGSILENIAWAEETPDIERATRAASLANALEFINALPQGFQTVVGEKGGRLSGGQRQRLALARALYRDPWLLILDEATSALDSKVENDVLRALEGIKGACSILIVAHRLATVKMADYIIVLDKGRIVEQGAWRDLLKNGDGVFARMAHLQGLTESD
jgi:ATP-binding cassette subfamily C protein